jgi:hypothetical protein
VNIYFIFEILFFAVDIQKNMEKDQIVL